VDWHKAVKRGEVDDDERDGKIGQRNRAIQPASAVGERSIKIAGGEKNKGEDFGPALMRRSPDLTMTWLQSEPERACHGRLSIRHEERFGTLRIKNQTRWPDSIQIQSAMASGWKASVKYPLAVASADLKQKFGGIEGLPTTMIYDQHGILRERVIGFEYTDVLDSAIKTLL
jgi:hypothetical protein